VYRCHMHNWIRRSARVIIGEPEFWLTVEHECFNKVPCNDSQYPIDNVLNSGVNPSGPDFF
jgi:hypothetical protein